MESMLKTFNIDHKLIGFDPVTSSWIRNADVRDSEN